MRLCSNSSVSCGKPVKRNILYQWKAAGTWQPVADGWNCERVLILLNSARISEQQRRTNPHSHTTHTFRIQLKPFRQHTHTCTRYAIPLQPLAAL